MVMATNNATRTRDRFFDAINETYEALLSGIEATEEQGHRVSRTVLAEARKGEKELSTLARTWVDTPSSIYENLEAMIDAQTRAQRRALELARDSLKGAGEYRDEVQEALRRMIRANRTAAEAMVEVARSASSRAARQVDRLPRPRRTRPRAARPARIPVAEGEVARRRAG
jgi:hypothetical protein